MSDEFRDELRRIIERPVVDLPDPARSIARGEAEAGSRKGRATKALKPLNFRKARGRRRGKHA